MNLPSLGLAIAFDHATRRDDEWFDEPDDLERLERALASIRTDDAVVAAASVAFRVARAQAFAEGNKRTAFLLARWILDRNGEDGRLLLPPEDRDFADLLVMAAAGRDVESDMTRLLQSRKR